MGQTEKVTQASSGVNRQNFIGFSGAAVLMAPDGLSAVSEQLTVEQFKQWHEEGARFKAVTPAPDLKLTGEI